jgi:hypothetical protein
MVRIMKFRCLYLNLTKKEKGTKLSAPAPML